MSEKPTIEKFAALIPDSLRSVSGSVFYSGRRAFSAPSPLYILGINPGGSPIEQATETVAWHTKKVLTQLPADWSAYRDESWRNNPPGTFRMQPRVLHMLRYLELNPGEVPSSNLLFERSAREADLKGRSRYLADKCWPLHSAVIEQLKIRVVVCFGKSVGDYVRGQLGATNQVDEFVETNRRNWRSVAYSSSNRVVVVVATHPSIADWTKQDTDPSPMIARLLESLT